MGLALQHSCCRVIILVFFLFTLPSTVQTITDQTNFILNSFSSDMPDIKFEGDAYAANGFIELTQSLDYMGENGSVGRATYFKPMHLWDNTSGNLAVADFSTHFSFVINSEGNDNQSDGLAFFLSANDSQLLPSSGGKYLGLHSDNYSGKQPKFVAVEFDTYGDDFDPVHKEHIGIDLNSLSSEKYVEWSWNDIYNGGRVEVSIDYVSSTKNLSVTVRNGDSETYADINYYSLSCIADLQLYLPEWVRFGFSAATTSPYYFERNQIYSWNFNSTLRLPDKNVTKPPNSLRVNTTSTVIGTPKKRKSKGWLWGVLGGGGLILILGTVWLGFWMKRTRQRGKGEDFDEAETGPRRFSYKELIVATNNFGNERLLGQGGFGMVYMGFLSSDRNSCVAVKKITSESRQGLKEYKSEVKTISRLRHRNLVQLIGWCRNKQELIIVYEFMPNKSLDFHLFNRAYLLTWDKRYGIALGLASALLYLQEECEQCVLHRDIKSSNVLLDSNFNAKLGDFGLAKLVEHGQCSNTTSVLTGTEGYVAPEYLQSKRATKESDVYSFGIVALEIASGKPALFKQVDGNDTNRKLELVGWVWKQYGKGNIFGAVDPQLSQNYIPQEMERLIVVGLACAHPNYFHRPSIREALDTLYAKAPLPILPPEMPVPPDIDSYQANTYAFSVSSSLGAGGSESAGQAQFSGGSANTHSSTTATSNST